MRARKPNAEHLTESLVRRLLASQLPQWANLPITPLEFDGWDNTTFRLGDDKSVRLPSGPWYAEQVDKEHRWLPMLAPLLPLPIPTPLAKGAPTPEFPLPWSVYGWIEGETAVEAPIDDLSTFAEDLAGFLVALQRVDPEGGPPPGRHNFYRGIPMATHDPQIPHKVPGNWGTIEAIADLNDRIDAEPATEVWEAALRSHSEDPPVWVHGDVAAGNLIVREGRLSAVIDFGCCAVGDPACDLVIAWTLFGGRSREAFRVGLDLDDGTWARGRGWALWKALISLVREDLDSPEAAWHRQVIDEVLADHASL